MRFINAATCTINCVINGMAAKVYSINYKKQITWKNINSNQTSYRFL